MLAIIFCACILVTFVLIVGIRQGYSFRRLAVVGILCFGCIFITSCSKDSRRVIYKIYLSGEDVKVKSYPDFVTVKCNRSHYDDNYTVIDENGNKTKTTHETFSLSRNQFMLKTGDTLIFDIIPGYKLDNCRIKGCDSLEYLNGQIKVTLDEKSKKRIYIILFLEKY